MRWNVVKSYMNKEFTEIIRSRLVFMVYVLPLMIIILFGYGIRMEVTGARTVIIDNDNSTISRLLVDKFSHSKYFTAYVENISEDEALHRIKKAEIDLIIIIPESFEKGLIHGQKRQIGVFIDAAFPSRASTIENYVKGIVLDAASSMASKKEVSSIISVNQRSLFNQAMRDEDAIVPGLIGLVLLISPAILSTLLVVKEKEKGTIFNFYSSPLSRAEFITSKLLPSFLFHTTNIFILLLVAIYLFEVPFRGSFLLYFLASELYIIISLSIGLLVSIITSTQIVALVLTIVVTMVPGFMYSGIIMPIASMSGTSYIQAHMFPVMYYNHIIYDVFLIGEGLKSAKTASYLAILLFFAIGFLFASAKLLKKELR